MSVLDASNLLVIDTSSRVCTVVMQTGKGVKTRVIEGHQSHGQSLLSAIDQLRIELEIELQQLSALAVVAGPGSFTGLRIGIGVVQGLAAALEIPVILLSSLEWHAWSGFAAYDCSHVTVCRKARDGEFYVATFQKGPDSGIQCIGGEVVVEGHAIVLPEVIERAGHWIAIGDGWNERDSFPAALLKGFSDVDCDLEADIESLRRIANFKLNNKQTVSAEQALPSYLKENMNYRTAG
jgi:tRNA threonylcarbamoyladenosine biosynthesis protein TsaB